MAQHILKYHVGVPLLIFAALVAVGVPVGSAVFVGAMAGCLSMMVMMMGERRSGVGDPPGDEVPLRRDSSAGPQDDSSARA